MDTSPGGDYYTSPSSPTSSSRNWTEDMEGGGAGCGGGAGLPVGVTAAAGTTCSGGHCGTAWAPGSGLVPGTARPPGVCSHASCALLEVKFGLTFPAPF